MAKVLVVDDNPDILDALDLLLSLHGHQVMLADNAKQALLFVQNKVVDIVIQDMNFTAGETSGIEGQSLFTAIQQEKPTLPIILLTAWTSLDQAVTMVKAGAADYLPKPWDDQKLIDLISEYGVSQPITNTSKQSKEVTIVHQCQAMQLLLQQANKVSQSDFGVLIGGPNGAGKEKLAEFIHAHSGRANAAFIKVNMGALPEHLMEAELFGAEKGAFTGASEKRIGRFEAANGGTLFLDEIGNLSLAGQMKLLRVLQTGEFERLGSSQTQKVDVRVLSATNADLKQAVAQGVFREDLLYRLNTIELTLPSLSERGEDVVLLAKHFLGQDYQMAEDAVDYLTSYSWPGNVRELENACKRAQVFANGNIITAIDFGAQVNVEPLENEKLKIANCLADHDWVIQRAAKSLGLSRQALYRRIEKYNLSKPDDLS